MNSDDWQKVKSIFNSALEVEAGGRDEFLVQVCNGDSVLRRKVEEMLSSYETGFPEVSAPGDGVGTDGDIVSHGRRPHRPFRNNRTARQRRNGTGILGTGRTS